MKIITEKLNDKVLVIKTTTESEEFVKKSSLENRRITLIEKHEAELAEIDKQLAYFI